MPEIFISIGSNIEPARRIRQGVGLLRERFGALRLSPVYESRAVGFEGDDFLNLAAAFESVLPPLSVKAELHAIEAACGRRRGGTRYAPRALDLDLLLYGDRVVEEEGLRLPRAEILKFAFVLKPLADLEGERLHPELERSFSELWAGFEGEGRPLWPVDIALE